MSPQAPQPFPERATRVRYWVIVFAVALAIVTYIDRVAMSVAMPFIARDLQLSTEQRGLIMSFFGWGYALFEIPGGYLGDWLGPRRVLMRIVIWWSTFTAATSLAINGGMLLVTQFLFGAGEAGCFPNLTKAYTIWLPRRERIRAQGITWLSARWGGAFTPLLLVNIIPAVGWRHAFQIFGCVGVVWAIAFYLWYRDDPMQNRSLNAAERDLLRREALTLTKHEHVPWSKLVASRQVWMLCWQYFCLSYGWYFYITWLPTYLREGRHVALITSGWLGILPLFCGGLGNPASVAIAARIYRSNGSIARTRRTMAYLGFTGAAGFLVLSTFLLDPVAAMVSIGLASFCNDLVMPGTWASAMDIGGKYAGTVSGTMNMCGNIGGALTPLVIGYLLKWSGHNWNLTFYVSAAIYLMGIVFWHFLDPVTPLEDAAESGLTRVSQSV